MTPTEMKKKCLMLKELLDCFPAALESYPIYLVMKGPIDKIFNDKEKENDTELRAVSGMFFLFFDMCSLIFGVETIYLTIGHFKLYINRIIEYISIIESGGDLTQALRNQVDSIDKKIKGESEDFSKQFSNVLDKLMKDSGGKRDPRKDN